jgi:hypothetical protein
MSLTDAVIRQIEASLEQAAAEQTASVRKWRRANWHRPAGRAMGGLAEAAGTLCGHGRPGGIGQNPKIKHN